MRKKQGLLTLFIVLCMVCSLNSMVVFGAVLQPVSDTNESVNASANTGMDTITVKDDTDASEENESKLAEKIIQNDARNGIVKIITGYEFEDTSFDKWVVGYGFLITKQQVIADRNVAVIDQNSNLYRTITGTRGPMYSRLGINLNDYQTTIKHVRTYILLDEGKVEAQANPNAIGDSFALLDLSQRINSKDVLTLSEDPMEDNTKIYAIGPYKIDSDDAKVGDIKPAQKTDFFGKLSSVTSHRRNGLSEYVEFKGNFQQYALAPGCPLVTKNQVVVGLITDGVKGNGSAVDIMTIEKVLDQANVEYIVDKPDQEDLPNTSELEKLIADYQKIDTSIYTKESVQNLNDELTNAKKLLSERGVSSNRIEKEYQLLSAAYAGLTKVDHKAFYIKIVLIVVVIIVLVVVAMFVAKLIHNRGKDEFEIEDERMEREAEKEKRKQERKAKKHENVVNTNYDNRAPEDDSGEDKTGVLDGQTGVLHENTKKAWLVHESGNRITINKNRFLIGKAQGVDYRINNNTVSRNHCRILTSGDDFYVEDLGSTNGTYIDGEQIGNVPTKITNGQQLVISDEHYTFEISGGS